MRQQGYYFLMDDNGYVEKRNMDYRVVHELSLQLEQLSTTCEGDD